MLGRTEGCKRQKQNPIVKGFEFVNKQVNIMTGMDKSLPVSSRKLPHRAMVKIEADEMSSVVPGIKRLQYYHQLMEAPRANLLILC